MNESSIIVDKQIAIKIVVSMTGETVSSATPMPTGDQHFVYAVKTTAAEYVIRIAAQKNKYKFISAIYWQKKLLPLGVPLAEFIQTDLEMQYAPFPSLLMHRLPGDDLCNVYSHLNQIDKMNLAEEIIKIQPMVSLLPEGSGFGFATSYEQKLKYKSWYHFLIEQLTPVLTIIEANAIFDFNHITQIISIAEKIRPELETIRPTPFLFDTSERNVIIHDGKISGIVDVDEICFGDPLFVIALTHVALENDGYDTLYTDYWSEKLQLTTQAQLRLSFYRLFYIVRFMSKHAMTTINQKNVQFDVDRLKSMFQHALKQLI